MRKLFFVLMAVAAMTLTSCLGKTEAPGQSDPQVEAPAEANDLSAALESLLKSGNGEGFFALVCNIQEKAISLLKDNPAKAKEYLNTAQQFLKKNAAQISEVLSQISNTDMAERAQEFIKSMSEQPVNQLLGIMGDVDGQMKDVQEAIDGQIGDIQDVVNEQLNDVQDAVGGILGK